MGILKLYLSIPVPGRNPNVTVAGYVEDGPIFHIGNILYIDSFRGRFPGFMFQPARLVDPFQCKFLDLKYFEGEFPYNPPPCKVTNRHELVALIRPKNCVQKFRYPLVYQHSSWLENGGTLNRCISYENGDIPASYVSLAARVVFLF